MSKPFQPVERLPVPPQVAESFRKLVRAQKGEALSSYPRGSRATGGKTGSIAEYVATRPAIQKAAAKVAQASEEAASHFGGDVAKMTTHLKRFVRWGGGAMAVAEMLPIPKEEFERGMLKARQTIAPLTKRSKPSRPA